MGPQSYVFLFQNPYLLRFFFFYKHSRRENIETKKDDTATRALLLNLMRFRKVWDTKPVKTNIAQGSPLCKMEKKKIKIKLLHSFF